MLKMLTSKASYDSFQWHWQDYSIKHPLSIVVIPSVKWLKEMAATWSDLMCCDVWSGETCIFHDLGMNTVMQHSLNMLSILHRCQWNKSVFYVSSLQPRIIKWNSICPYKGPAGLWGNNIVADSLFTIIYRRFGDYYVCVQFSRVAA